MKIMQLILNKPRNYILNLSLRKKLFIVFLIASIIPTIFLAYYSYTTIKTQLTKQTNDNVNNTLKQINQNIEKKLEDYSQFSSIIYVDSPLKEYLTFNYENSQDFLDAYHYIDGYFYKKLTINNDLAAMSIYAYNNTLPSDATFIKNIKEAEKSVWYKSVINSSGNVIYSDTHKNIDKIYVFTACRLLNYQSLNYPYGILAIDVKESEIYSLIEKENMNKYVFITDNYGNIISASNKDFISKNINSMLQSNKLPVETSGTFSARYNDEKVLVIYNTIKNGWKTVAVIPEKSFLQSAKRSTGNLLLVALIAIIIAIILIFLTSEFFTRRIDRLLKYIKRVGKGDFDVKLEHMGCDEIGQLGDAFNSMSSKLKKLIEEVYEKEIQKKEAEITTLQSQINPHFLYNCLSSISALALRNNDKPVNDMANLLAKFYRISLSKGKNIISIREEMDLTKYYISIQQKRFSGLLHIHFKLDETLFEYNTTKLILQPFIENCINHAIWNDDTGITIVIKLIKEEDHILFEVIDDGIGMRIYTSGGLPPDSSEKSSGYGIRNVDQRIKLYFGSSYGLSVYSRPGFGTKVQVRIPMKDDISFKTK